MQKKFRFVGLWILLSILLTSGSQEATMGINLNEIYTLEEISIFNNSGSDSTNLEMKDNIAYLTKGVGGVKIVDMNNVIEPQEISTFVEFGNLDQIVMGVDLYGKDRMVVYTATGNLYPADISDLNSIFQLAGYSWYSGVPYSDLIKMRNMFQNNLFAIEGSTFYVYTLNDAGNFDLYAHVLGDENGFSDATGMFVTGDGAFVSSSTGFEWYRLGDTFSEFKQLGSVDGLSISQKHNSFGNLYVNHTNVFVVTGSSNNADVTIFDISTKTIEQVGTILIGERINEVRAVEDELYVIGDDFIQIYNMSISTQPTLTHSRTINSSPTSIIVDNNFIYISQLNDGLITYVKDDTTLGSETPSSETDGNSETLTSFSSSESTDLDTQIRIAIFPFMFTIIGLIVILTFHRKR